MISRCRNKWSATRPTIKSDFITLDRAAKLNAINAEMKDQIIDAFAQADKDPTTSVIVLRAEGRSFSAGFDIGMSPDRGKIPARPIRIPGTRCCTAASISECRPGPRPSRYRLVQGHVLGGGCELTMMCDLTIAADDAKFGEPEVRFSHLGPLMVMPWIIGLKRAREMLFFGDMIDANTALQFGMVNRVVPAAELRSATLKYAKRLALISPEALRWGKRVINRELKSQASARPSRRELTCSYRSTRPRPRSAKNSDASSRRRT